MGSEVYGSGTKPRVGDTQRIQLVKDLQSTLPPVALTQPYYLTSRTTAKTSDTRLFLLAKKLGALQNSKVAPNPNWNPKPWDTVRTLLLKLEASQAGL